MNGDSWMDGVLVNWHCFRFKVFMYWQYLDVSDG